MHLDQDQARVIARDNPKQLLQILSDRGRSDRDLYFAAESAGNTREPGVIEALVYLLMEHPVGVVREGAAYGLAPHADDNRALEALRRAAEVDKSEAVRLAAADALDRP